jgi:hypothetical protein
MQQASGFEHLSIHNFISSRANPFHVYSYIQANQESAEESCQGLSNNGILASMQRPVFGTNIIRHIKHYQMRVICDLGFKQGSDCSVIIDDYHHILKAVD